MQTRCTYFDTVEYSFAHRLQYGIVHLLCCLDHRDSFLYLWSVNMLSSNDLCQLSVGKEVVAQLIEIRREV